jgi:small-conductance mechanosensitive channel
MTPVLDLVFLGNTVRTWIITGGAAVAGYLLLALVLAFVRNRLTRFAARTRTQWDDVFVVALGKTSSLFLLALVVSGASALLALPDRARSVISAISILALVLQGGIWFSAAFTAWFSAHARKQHEVDRRAGLTVSAIGFMVKLALWSIIVLLALDNLGVNISALIAGLGIGGVAVALATQNILGDLFASFSIFIDKPFGLGDYIVVEDHQGTVEKVGLKTTRVRSIGGEQIVFSNTDLTKSRLRNFGRMSDRRALFSVRVVYQTPRDQLAGIPRLLREAIESQENVRFERAHLREYGDIGIRFEAVYFVLSADFNLYLDIQQAVNLRIHQAFESQGIQFAYPGHLGITLPRRPDV